MLMFAFPAEYRHARLLQTKSVGTDWSLAVKKLNRMQQPRLFHILGSLSGFLLRILHCRQCIFLLSRSFMTLATVTHLAYPRIFHNTWKQNRLEKEFWLFLYPKILSPENKHIFPNQLCHFWNANKKKKYRNTNNPAALFTTWRKQERK